MSSRLVLHGHGDGFFRVGDRKLREQPLAIARCKPVEDRGQQQRATAGSHASADRPLAATSGAPDRRSPARARSDGGGAAGRCAVSRASRSLSSSSAQALAHLVHRVAVTARHRVDRVAAEVGDLLKRQPSNTFKWISRAAPRSATASPARWRSAHRADRGWPRPPTPATRHRARRRCSRGAAQRAVTRCGPRAAGTLLLVRRRSRAPSPGEHLVNGVGGPGVVREDHQGVTVEHAGEPVVRAADSIGRGPSAGPRVIASYLQTRRLDVLSKSAEEESARRSGTPDALDRRRRGADEAAAAPAPIPASI